MGYPAVSISAPGRERADAGKYVIVLAGFSIKKEK
jgi:hypothetical protein